MYRQISADVCTWPFATPHPKVSILTGCTLSIWRLVWMQWRRCSLTCVTIQISLQDPPGMTNCPRCMQTTGNGVKLPVPRKHNGGLFWCFCWGQICLTFNRQVQQIKQRQIRLKATVNRTTQVWPIVQRENFSLRVCCARRVVPNTQQCPKRFYLPRPVDI